MPLPTFHYDKWRTGWYRLSPTGVAEERGTHHAARITPNATVIRGVLDLPGSSFGIRNSSLIDAAGRRVLDLAPGANDVSSLAPGVYFVRAAAGGANGNPDVVRVLVAR